MKKKSVIQYEKHVVLLMIMIYGRHCLHQKLLSKPLRELARYCFDRLDHCRFGEEKGPCKRCPIHCYSKQRREEIKKIMRWSGPRMIFLAPYQAFRHAR